MTIPNKPVMGKSPRENPKMSPIICLKRRAKQANCSLVKSYSSFTKVNTSLKKFLVIYN